MPITKDCVFYKWYRSLPGVENKIFTPFLSRFFSWLVCYPPINKPGTINGHFLRHLNVYFCPWIHNSRLGHIISIAVPNYLFVITFLARYWLIRGIRYANVFPLPVAALTITFYPLKMGL